MIDEGANLRRHAGPARIDDVDRPRRIAVRVEHAHEPTARDVIRDEVPGELHESATAEREVAEKAIVVRPVTRRDLDGLP